MGSRYISFTVPAGAGAYAPEVIYLNADNQPGSIPDTVAEFTLDIESLPAGAQIEVDVLRASGGQTTVADWQLARKVFAAAGLQAPVGVSGAKLRVRAKSGGNAGAAPVSAWWL